MQFKRSVEDIVRSIPAEESQKNKYRLELYAHLHGLYEEERLRHRDESSAFRAALNRLGQPESLRAEFLKSLSPMSRWVGRLDYATSCQPNESIRRHMIRIGSICLGSYSVAVYGLLFPLVIALNDQPLDMTVAAAVFGIFIGVNISVFMMMISVLQLWARRIIDSTSPVRRKYLRMAGVSASLSLVIWVLTFGSLHALLAGAAMSLGETHAAVALLDHVKTGLAPVWCSVLTVIVAILPPLLSLDRRIPDWPYAE